MELKRPNGEVMFINDADAIQRFYEAEIQSFQIAMQNGPLSAEDENKLKEDMFFYNQIVEKKKEERLWQLETQIEAYRSVANQRELTDEEKVTVNNLMNQYNSLVTPVQTQNEEVSRSR